MGMVSVSIAVVFIAVSIASSAVLAVRGSLDKGRLDFSSGAAYCVFSSAALMAVSDLIIGTNLNPRLMNDITLASSALMVMTSSVWKVEVSMKYVYFLTVNMLLILIYQILSLFLPLPVPEGAFFVYSSVLIIILTSIIFLAGLCVRIGRIRDVLKSGTVWTNLSLSVEVIYILNLFIYVTVFGISGTYVQLLVLVLSLGLYASLGARVSTGCLFVFRQRHEQRIVESMKVTQVEVIGDSSRIDENSKEIFDRIQDYFYKEKPYLKGDLAINDIVKVLYTNKLYISRAISQNTGRNFCQYVNYHRVNYSVELFRFNPKLKVHELANRSGFNTVVSFNMAFRLYMGENPSDWCRKEKNRLTGGKK